MEREVATPLSTRSSGWRSVGGPVLPILSAFAFCTLAASTLVRADEAALITPIIKSRDGRGRLEMRGDENGEPGYCPVYLVNGAFRKGRMLCDTPGFNHESFVISPDKKWILIPGSCVAYVCSFCLVNIEDFTTVVDGTDIVINQLKGDLSVPKWVRVQATAIGWDGLMSDGSGGEVWHIGGKWEASATGTKGFSAFRFSFSAEQVDRNGAGRSFEVKYRWTPDGGVQELQRASKKLTSRRK